eukprot:scaffold48_cov161-Amphora_coffeaeformis.AAC.15
MILATQNELAYFEYFSTTRSFLLLLAVCLVGFRLGVCPALSCLLLLRHFRGRALGAHRTTGFGSADGRQISRLSQGTAPSAIVLHKYLLKVKLAKKIDILCVRVPFPGL